MAPPQPPSKAAILQATREEAPEALTDKLSQEYREKFANPYIAAERGFIDDIILPRRTRPRLIDALSMLETKVDTNPRKKHGNIPL